MGLELPSQVLAFEAGRGKAHIFSTVTGRKMLMYRFSRVSVIIVMPIPAASVYPGPVIAEQAFRFGCRCTLIDFVHRTEWLLILFCLVVGSKFSPSKVIDISEIFFYYYSVFPFHQKQSTSNSMTSFSTHQQ